MIAAAPLSVSNAVTYGAPAAAPAAKPAGGMSFSEFLSDINPLQYLPVIGTIYRAVTGDTIPKSLREAGSVVVSGLTGGPIGIATSLGALAFEKLTGIDFEDIEQGILTGHGSEANAATAVAAGEPGPPPVPADERAAAPGAALGANPGANSGAIPVERHVAGAAWSPAQLAAYGVVTQSNGTLRQSALSGSDVLNALQLQEIGATALA